MWSHSQGRTDKQGGVVLCQVLRLGQGLLRGPGICINSGGELMEAINGKEYALNYLRNPDGSITEYATVQEALDALAERDKGVE